jgi:hypothetical protein
MYLGGVGASLLCQTSLDAAVYPVVSVIEALFHHSLAGFNADSLVMR